MNLCVRNAQKGRFSLRQGAASRKDLPCAGPEVVGGGFLKSAIAVPLYAVALPVCLMMGSHVFVVLHLVMNLRSPRKAAGGLRNRRCR